MAMTPSLRVAALGLVFSLTAAAADARDQRTKPATPRERAATEATARFSVRMGRLDALMGGVPHNAATTARARSANAEY